MPNSNGQSTFAIPGYNILDPYSDDVVWGEAYPESTGTKAAQKYPIHSKIGDGLRMVKGRYRLTVENVSPNADFSDFDGLGATVPVDGVEKKYTIDRISYDVGGSTLLIDITIIDNPIPLFVLWGAIAITVAIIGALSVNSVLTKVETLANSPAGKGIVMIFLIPAALLLLNFFKKG
jgi:hypothetical protein